MFYLVVTLAFVAGFLFIFGLNLLLLNLAGDRPSQVRKRLEEELQSQQKNKAKGSMANKELFELMAEGYGDLAVQPTAIEKFRIMIEQSGMSVRLGQVVTMTLVCAWCRQYRSGFCGAGWSRASSPWSSAAFPD